MALSPPFLPQAINNVITTAQIEEAYGIVVEIPIDASFSFGDIITLHLNQGIYQALYLSGEEPIRITYGNPANYQVGVNKVHYTHRDSHGNEFHSPAVEFYIERSARRDHYTVNVIINNH